MSFLFEDSWSESSNLYLLDRLFPFGGSIPDVHSPLSYHDAPQDGVLPSNEDKHPAICGHDVWMGSPEQEAQPLLRSGSLSPLPVTLRPPSPPSACVSPQDIFATVATFGDDEDTDEVHPPLSPVLTGSSPSGSSPGSSASSGDSIFLSTPAFASVPLLSPTQSLTILSLGPAPTSPQPKRPFQDYEPSSPELSPTRNRHRSTTSFVDRLKRGGSDEAVAPRGRAKSSTLRRRRPERRVVCRGCERDFGRLAELTRHKKSSCPARIHVGDETSSASQPHQCKKCGKALSRSDALARHEKAGDGACRKHLATLSKTA